MCSVGVRARVLRFQHPSLHSGGEFAVRMMDLQVTLFLLIVATLGFCCVEIRSCWRQYRLSIETQRHVFASQNRLIFLSEDYPAQWNLEIPELIMNKLRMSTTTYSTALFLSSIPRLFHDNERPSILGTVYKLEQ